MEATAALVTASVFLTLSSPLLYMPPLTDRIKSQRPHPSRWRNGALSSHPPKQSPGQSEECARLSGVGYFSLPLMSTNLARRSEPREWDADEHGFPAALTQPAENSERRVEEEKGFFHSPPRHVHRDLQLWLTLLPLAILAALARNNAHAKAQRAQRHLGHE
jgi:hypothetical protein